VHHAAGGPGALWFAVFAAFVVGATLTVGAWSWRASRRSLRRCPVCAAAAVRVLDCDSFRDLHAWVTVQCGQCGTWRRLLTSPRHARQHARAVRRDRAEIIAGIDRMVLERRRDDLHALTRALRAQVVGVEDFLALTRGQERTGRG
jgi:hypothetical protein